MRSQFVFIILLLAAGCSDQREQAQSSEQLGMVAGRQAAKDQAASAPPAPPPMPAAPPEAGAPQGQPVVPPMLIRTGHVQIEVDSLEAAVTAVQQLAARFGGNVMSVATQTGNEQLREATLTLRIPAPRFDEAVGGLKPLGKVESVMVSSEDVGEQYVDIEVRLQNGRRLETRLLELLQNRTGKLEEVLAVERELARVREEIERYEGRMRYLRSRVDMSTLTVTLHEPRPLLSNPRGQNVIAYSFGLAWRNFVGLVAGLIASLGIIIPFAVVALAVWLLIRRRK